MPLRLSADAGGMSRRGTVGLQAGDGLEACDPRTRIDAPGIVVAFAMAREEQRLGGPFQVDGTVDLRVVRLHFGRAIGDDEPLAGGENPAGAVFDRSLPILQLSGREAKGTLPDEVQLGVGHAVTLERSGV